MNAESATDAGKIEPYFTFPITAFIRPFNEETNRSEANHGAVGAISFV